MVVVLRLGHRKKRDARISTHVGLVGRAFGAKKIIYSGQYDEKMMNSVRNVVQNWGGPFSVSYAKNWRNVIKNFKGTKIHLSMYSLPLQKQVKKLQKKKLLLIVGGEKVPGEVYRLVDLNIAVTNQPHSEVAALAVFLHELFGGKELNKKFVKAKLRIIPQERGKRLNRKTD
jgi:tRNA (cytidine56-2'-O)-methyltransferase